MELHLLRDNAQPLYTEGKISIEGIFECFSLEPDLGDGGLDCAMPPGRYPIRIRWSTKFQKMLAHIDNVPGREAIEIHDGNTPKDTLGCVLPGRDREPGQVLQSDVARAQLQSKIAQAQAHQEPVWLTVENPPVEV